MKYSDQITDWLVQMNYTHCFYVGGGNIMHLIESFSHKLVCIPVIHEVAAGIAAEYFNESSNGKKAVALVTAGPGLTNIVTAVAGAFLESRELLVIGGQVKTADLAKGKLRQRGIQEIDGVSIVKPIAVRSVLLEEAVDFSDFFDLVNHVGVFRKGPVFIEMPIDVQARDVQFSSQIHHNNVALDYPQADDNQISKVIEKINAAKRPLLLIGGGVNRATTRKLKQVLASLQIPIATTWNAADRIPSNQPNYVGRPNTWGQRSANLILQQSDLVIAVGTRLGMQQTGFNWQSFVPKGEVIQIDIDQAELDKAHPKVAFPILADANAFLSKLVNNNFSANENATHLDWLAYTGLIRASIPLVEPINQTRSEYLSPYIFAEKLSQLSAENDVIVPCSSGGAFTIMMQAFEQKSQQTIVTNKGLASMGYGLSGAIGAAFAHPDKRVILVEGDGGFSQNIQEIGTASINKLNLKIFIFDDSGYASIRATQRNYFGGRYVGCDRTTGLGLPNWEKLFMAWGVPSIRVNVGYESDEQFKKMFDSKETCAFIVSIDPEQTYFPKITSKITTNGAMESNSLHLMTPNLPEDQFSALAKYLIN
ncbi:MULTISPECIES: thiamine pyrophosphate-binding protein [Methylotenera]|uniref:thiamine pyrophosphate-binding protein n=1 Tax=Methylotenera TaxID=359407 RepID=UPI00037B2540|nr:MULTISPECIES: thiamine pyrophosphate-binding protein [Methylotenera]